MAKNCFWFTSGEKDNKMMKAMCENCHKTHIFGWFWEGSKLGFGPYSLKCEYCGDILNESKDEKVKK